MADIRGYTCTLFILYQTCWILLFNDLV